MPGPDGTFFLTTSHSPNRKGRTSKARRQLLLHAPEGHRLAVKGRLDLTALAAGLSPQQIAGAGAKAPLDIEALACREDAPFVGLKSPLTEGQAVILRLDSPLATARAGRIADGKLTRWAMLPLCVERDGERVCQGDLKTRFHRRRFDRSHGQRARRMAAERSDGPARRRGRARRCCCAGSKDSSPRASHSPRAAVWR